MAPRAAIRLEWTGRGVAFRGRAIEREGPEVVIDGDGAAGPSPMDALLLAAAGCTAADVVLMLRKMQVELEQCVVLLEGTRREEDPRRYVGLRFRYRLRGGGITPTKARRAIDLSLERYCSVVHSLAPDLEITYDLDLA